MWEKSTNLFSFTEQLLMISLGIGNSPLIVSVSPILSKLRQMKAPELLGRSYSLMFTITFLLVSTRNNQKHLSWT